jgi:hypothetical protein
MKRADKRTEVQEILQKLYLCWSWGLKLTAFVGDPVGTLTAVYPVLEIHGKGPTTWLQEHYLINFPACNMKQPCGIAAIVQIFNLNRLHGLHFTYLYTSQ